MVESFEILRSDITKIATYPIDVWFYGIYKDYAHAYHLKIGMIYKRDIKKE